MLNYENCITGYNKTKKVCTDERDEGYNTCTDWSKDCVSWAKNCIVKWIPLIGPLICKVFEWVCKGFEWVCKGVVWVRNMVCHGWNFITTFVCLTLETLFPILFLIGIFIKLILSIPLLGALIKQALNLITGFVLGLVGFIVEGGLCGLLGMCLPKKLRVCIIMIKDNDRPPFNEGDVDIMVDTMKQIYRDEARIDIYSFKHFGSAPQVKPSCGGTAWLQDLWLNGSRYENEASLKCREYSLSSIIGLGSPIYAFAVRDVQGKNGCSLALLSNYILFEFGSTACTGNTHLAHEVGHACNLLIHATDSSNLMYKSCVMTGRNQISPFQKYILRGSKYVTYF